MPPANTPAQVTQQPQPQNGNDPVKHSNGRQRKTASKITKIQTNNADRVPSEPPSFTIAQIRQTIPPHCFQRSYFKSFGHLIVDLSIMCSLFYLCRFIETSITDAEYGVRVGPLLRHILWMVYWAVQGCTMTGLWVIGHECGHGGFSDSETVNDVVGLIVHSYLLVPYFSWKTSHRRHHSNTNNLGRDEVFVPYVESSTSPSYGINHDEHDDHHNPITAIFSSLVRSFHIVVMLTIGWPLYLFLNATSHDYGKRSIPPNHFLPSSPIFATDRQRREVLITDMALLVVLFGFYKTTVYLGGFWSFFYVYGVPYMITNLFLVLITYLQHSDLAVPHYTATEWDWLRGALATIDRNYGFFNVLNHVFHHITDTHVVHHLFSDMPFYHAQEATEAVKPLLGKYYRFDDTPITTALWRNFAFKSVGPDTREDSNKGVLWFHHGK